MTGFVRVPVLIVIFMLLLLTAVFPEMETEGAFFKVTIDTPENGNIGLEPAVPADGKVAAGSVIRVTAAPDKGYAYDGGYYAMPGRWGKMFYESMTLVFDVVVDNDKMIGASFIKKEKLDGFRVIQDVVYSHPGIKKLKYDAYIPDGAKDLPGIVIIHGGGWSTNTEDIMRGLARELVRDGRYVVFSIDYRWIGTVDGDEVPNTMADLIGDVFGAIAHIHEHSAEYGCDPMRIAVTGDSAGGHLSAAAVNMCTKIGDGGFGKTPGVYEFLPSYIPAGKTAEQVRNEISRALRAAAPSYGVFDGASLANFTGGSPDSPEVDAVAPIKNIPEAKERAVPQYLTRGSLDMLITDEAVRAYADALEAAGQTVQYDIVEGANHAFFDWKPDAQTKAVFARYGVPYAARMKAFFDAVFYP